MGAIQKAPLWHIQKDRTLYSHTSCLFRTRCRVNGVFHGKKENLAWRPLKKKVGWKPYSCETFDGRQLCVPDAWLADNLPPLKAGFVDTSTPCDTADGANIDHTHRLHCVYQN